MTVRADVLEGELVKTNNEISTFVRVIKGGLAVLYIEGQYRWEARFLREALARSPDMLVEFWVLSRPLKGGDDTRQDNPFSDLSDYDVIILGDIPAGRFGSVHLSAGAHSFEWIGFEAGGGDSWELSVAVGAGKVGPVTSANGWKVVGDPTPHAEIELSGPIDLGIVGGRRGRQYQSGFNGKWLEISR